MVVSQSRGRAAAWTAAAILAVSAGFLFYWGLGGTWACGAEPPPYGQIYLVIVGALCVVYAGVLLVRVGYWREHVPSAVARFADISAWVIVIVPLGGGLNAFAAADPVGGAVDLIVAALAFVVVRSGRSLSPTSRAAPMPSGRPGPPTSAR